MKFNILISLYIFGFNPLNGIFFKTTEREAIKEHWHTHNILLDDQNNNKKNVISPALQRN